MPQEQIFKKNYEIKNFTITNETINDFEIMPNRRLISDGQVKKIHGVLLEGKNPIGILIVNKKHDKLRLIDGNHRIEAVKRFYSYRNPNAKIECILKIYNDLNEDEERQVYSDEANRRNESYEDRLNMYKDVITFWKLLNDSINKFPCNITIYPSKTSIRFRLLLDALLTIKTSKNGYTYNSVKKSDLITFASELNYDDYIQLKEFILFFIEVFGSVSKDNIYTHAQIFVPLMDIYYRNKGKTDKKMLIQRFQKILNKSDIIIYSSTSSREYHIKLRKTMIDYMNFGYSANSINYFI